MELEEAVACYQQCPEKKDIPCERCPLNKQVLDLRHFVAPESSKSSLSICDLLTTVTRAVKRMRIEK